MKTLQQYVNRPETIERRKEALARFWRGANEQSVRDSAANRLIDVIEGIRIGRPSEVLGMLAGNIGHDLLAVKPRFSAADRLEMAEAA